MAGLLVSVILFSAAGLLHGFVVSVFHSTAIALLALPVIHKASTGFQGKIGTTLESKPMVYIGKISYGLYLYHSFIPKLYQKAVEKLNLQNVSLPFTEGYTLDSFLANQYLTFPLYFLTAIIVASVSWFLIERPINNLKNRFGYERKINIEPVSTI
jgi:peptidoglycan/LPS O-acetylase OafA/YrhL